MEGLIAGWGTQESPNYQLLSFGTFRATSISIEFMGEGLNFLSIRGGGGIRVAPPICPPLQTNNCLQYLKYTVTRNLF